MKTAVLITVILLAGFCASACSSKEPAHVPYPTSQLSAQDADVSSNSNHTWKMVTREISPDEKAESPTTPIAPENTDDFFASAATAVYCKITDIKMLAFGAQEDDEEPELGDMRCVLTAEVIENYTDTPLKLHADGKSIIIRYDNAINKHYKCKYDFNPGDECFLIISEEKAEAIGMTWYPQDFVDEYPYYMYYSCGAVIEKVGSKYNAYTLMELYNGKAVEYNKDKRTQKLYTKSTVEKVIKECADKMRNISGYELYKEITQRNSK